MAISLLIVGASVRSMVASAQIAGYNTLAVDLFDDWDTQFWVKRRPLGKSIQIDNFQAASGLDLPADYLILCGGIESRVHAVQELRKKYRVLGPNSNQLDRLCRGEGLSALKAAKFSVPKSKPALAPEDAPSKWLLKPRGRAGGAGIRIATETDINQPHDRNRYFQLVLHGKHVSALFVSFNRPSKQETHLIGITEQLVGLDAFAAPPFCYCGSVGPVRLGDEQERQVRDIGQCLANAFDLVGIWGIDFVVNTDGVWPVDINPRITASAELFDRQIGRSHPALHSIVGLHVAACQDSAIEFKPPSTDDSQIHFESKAILFNRSQHSLVIDESIFESLKTWFEPDFFTDDKLRFSIADVPRPKTTIPRGHPILTIRVRGQTHEQVHLDLERHSQNVYRLLDAT